MRRGGFTLLEIMIVVAIVGVMASLSAYGLTQAVKVGRANAAADFLVSVIRETRVRAVSEQCTYFIQIDGDQYVAGGPPAGSVFQPNSTGIVRKGVCDSTTMTFELPGPPGDDLTTDIGHFADAFVDITVTPGVVAADNLKGNALIIGYNRYGQRMVASGNGGAFADVAALGITPLTLTVSPHDATVTRQVIIPAANGPSTN